MYHIIVIVNCSATFLLYFQVLLSSTSSTGTVLNVVQLHIVWQFADLSGNYQTSHLSIGDTSILLEGFSYITLTQRGHNLGCRYPEGDTTWAASTLVKGLLDLEFATSIYTTTGWQTMGSSQFLSVWGVVRCLLLRRKPRRDLPILNVSVFYTKH